MIVFLLLDYGDYHPVPRGIFSTCELAAEERARLLAKDKYATMDDFYISEETVDNQSV